MGLASLRKDLASRLTQAPARFLAGKVSPNALTVLGFLISLVAAAVVARGFLVLGGILVLLAGLLDLLDGAVARRAGKATPFGAVLDSTLDRLSEAALLLGLLFLLRGSALVYLIYALLVGSFLVSYIRARGEGLGLPSEAGLFTRGERIVVLALGLITGLLTPALALVTVLSWFTVGQRLGEVWRQTRSPRGGLPPGQR